MKSFIHDDFMLSTDAARDLYHSSAADQSIIDYHCHLDPRVIAENRLFGTITDVWLGGDHYKWRALRGNGIDERYITGEAGPYEKFEKWAETVPFTMRNPLYHWTHLELKRGFGIDQILKPETAREIYEECNAKLATDAYRPRELMRMFNVEAVCTTDDPADDLQYHRQIKEDGFEIKVLPTWRPDNAIAVENPEKYIAYIGRLGRAAEMRITSLAELFSALKKRHDYFAEAGCRLSDHGMATFYADDFTDAELDRIFKEVLSGKVVSAREADVFKSGMLYHLAVMDAEKDWTQQFHFGVIRSTNTRMFNRVGPDTGFDAILDMECAEAGHRFLDRLDRDGNLAKTIIYNLNPKDNEVVATMCYTFNDGKIPGKMQMGAAWWFLDQEDGMRRQMNALSSLGLLSRFVGMLTDSRSFLSYTRHEYFRRILCDMLGADIESGRFPASEMDFIHSMVRGICYGNAKNYFNF